jgi:hypothetical protein
MMGSRVGIRDSVPSTCTLDVDMYVPVVGIEVISKSSVVQDCTHGCMHVDVGMYLWPSEKEEDMSE